MKLAPKKRIQNTRHFFLLAAFATRSGDSGAFGDDMFGEGVAGSVDDVVFAEGCESVVGGKEDWL